MNFIKKLTKDKVSTEHHQRNTIVENKFIVRLDSSTHQDIPSIHKQGYNGYSNRTTDRAAKRIISLLANGKAGRRISRNVAQVALIHPHRPALDRITSVYDSDRLREAGPKQLKDTPTMWPYHNLHARNSSPHATANAAVVRSTVECDKSTRLPKLD